MKFALGLTISMLLAGNAVASGESSQWVSVATTSVVNVDALQGSFRYMEKSMTGTFRFTNRKSQERRIAIISDETCANGEGILYLTVSLSAPPQQTIYYKDDNNVAAHIGNMLCAANPHFK